jgi:hypothetical protein
VKDGRRRQVRLAITFVVLFGICCLSLFPHGRATTFNLGAGRADSTAEELVPKLTDQDASHYVGLGYDIAQRRRIPVNARVSFTQGQPMVRSVLNLWPPGMHLYYAALFAVFGPEMPVALVIGITTAVLWALLLTAFVDLLTRRLQWFAVAILLAVVLVSDVVQERILGDRLLWSEGPFTWLVLAAIYAAARAATARSDATCLGWAAAVGALLGVSAYVRTVADPLGWLMLLVVAGWGAIVLVRRLWRARRVRRDATADAGSGPNAAAVPARSNWNRHLVALLVCTMAFQVVTIPWRVYAAERLRPGNYNWTTATNRYWHESWMPDREFRERAQGWLLVGRPNTACKVDPDTCARIARYERAQLVPYSGTGRYSEEEYRRLAIRAIREHPVAFAADRLYFLNRAWFWQPQERVPEYLHNAIALLALVASGWLLVRRFRRVGPDLLTLLFPGLVVVSLVPFVFLHYEPRYFATVKVVALVLPAVLLCFDTRAAAALRIARPDADEAAPGPEAVPAGEPAAVSSPASSP